jgi:hypothetical protein
MQMRKNCTFSNILLKVKVIFLPISIIPVKLETLKPPTAGGQPIREQDRRVSADCAAILQKALSSQSR